MPADGTPDGRDHVVAAKTSSASLPGTQARPHVGRDLPGSETPPSPRIRQRASAVAAESFTPKGQ